MNILADRIDAYSREISAAADGFAALVPAFKTCRESFIDLGREMYDAAEKAYLAEYGKLPGSIRNARLAKKQHDLVWRWFIDKMENVERQSSAAS